MKKVFLILSFALFTFSLNATSNATILAVGCTTTVSTDCDGDGLIDFEDTVSCANAAGTVANHNWACNNPAIID
jgi:hypothetical protein